MNQLVLAVLAPVLILAGILGFVVPPQRALTSGAPAYNVFHLIFGVLGGVIALTGNDPAIGAFLIGFGLIDLYQAVASKRDLFPKTWFRWRWADDVLHVVVGAALVVVGMIGIITN
ncbi:MAG: hypothetical protein HY826_11250 [Actinobacteria bacterium]|nr:hypothetical protein [Actinomycetota bacterium]